MKRLKKEGATSDRRRQETPSSSGHLRLTSIMALAVFASLIIIAAPVHAQNTPVFNVVLTTQTPYPAEPGKNVNVEVQVQNTGLGDANNVVVEIDPTAPFTLLPGSDKTTTYTKISASSSVKLSYDLKVDDDAVSNQYELEFRIYYANEPSSYLSQKVMVNVQGEPDFIIDSTWTSPENIEPGGTVDLFVKLKNVGTGTASKAQLNFNSSSGLLIPVLSGGSVYLGDIEPGNDSVADIKISVDSSAGQQTYPSLLTLAYTDSTGTARQETFSLGVPVTGVIDLEIINIQANFDRDVLQISVANKGTADADSVQGTLFMNNKSLGVDYTSQLKATKQTTLEFPLGPEGPANLVLTYKSPNLQSFQVDKPLDVTYENPNQSSPAGTAIAVIVVVVVVYFVWRRFFRKKKKKAV